MTQRQYWIEYAADWRNYPLAYWVHVEQDGKHWWVAEHFMPDAPRPIPHRGYRILCVDVKGVVLRFSSRAQLTECIRVLSMTPLPTTRRLCALRGTTAGPNGHWLSELPAKLKSPKSRALVVKALTEAAHAEF